MEARAAPLRGCRPPALVPPARAAVCAGWRRGCFHWRPHRARCPLWLPRVSYFQTVNSLFAARISEIRCINTYFISLRA